MWDNLLNVNNWSYEMNEIFDSVDIDVLENGGLCKNCNTHKLKEKLVADIVDTW